MHYRAQDGDPARARTLTTSALSVDRPVAMQRRRVSIAGLALLGCMAFSACGNTKRSATASGTRGSTFETPDAKAKIACHELSRELEVTLAHGVSNPGPTVLPTEIRRTATESIPLVSALVEKLRQLDPQDPSILRSIGIAESNRAALEKIVKPTRHGNVLPELRNLYRAEGGCLSLRFVGAAPTSPT
jgi:hypothetical protein